MLKKKILGWIGLGAAVVGAIAAVIAIFPSPKARCGEESFLSKQLYEKLSNKTSSEQVEPIKKESLYTPSGEPKDASNVIIESSPELTALSHALQSGNTFAQGQMIFVYGAGGSGKSVVMNILKLKGAPHTAFIDVGQQFKIKQQTETINKNTEPKPELKIRDRVISEMPQLNDDVLADGLEGLFKTAGLNQSLADTHNVIVDSIDELHPVSAVRIIDVAMKYVLLHPEKNVVLAGRGEAFRDYFEMESYSRKNFRAIHLKPMYVGEEPMLTWFVWQTLRFEYNRNTVNKQSQDLPSKETATKLVGELINLWRSRPALRQFMVTLEPARSLISHVKDKYDPDQLVELHFHRTTARNRERHYRPTQSDGETWSLYQKALVQTARIARLKPGGSFVLPVQQTVNIRVGSECVAVNAGEVLNLSELIDLEPFDKDHLIYRFYPRNFHKYLAEQKSD